MELSSNFKFDFSNILSDPMQNELTESYNTLLADIKIGEVYYNNLKSVVVGIMLEENNPPTVESVDLLNADLGLLLVALEEGGLNLGNLGSATFGMNLSGFDFDIATGKMNSMPLSLVNSMVKWVQNAIETSTNKQYLNTVIWLSKLMKSVKKSTVEKVLILIDSIKALEVEPSVSLEEIIKKLSSIGLSFNEDPNISKIDVRIPELFVQKHLVTTKLYSAIEDKLTFLAGYDPIIMNEINNKLNLNYDYKPIQQTE